MSRNQTEFEILCSLAWPSEYHGDICYAVIVREAVESARTRWSNGSSRPAAGGR
jgi:hypothetical protein